MIYDRKYGDAQNALLQVLNDNPAHVDALYMSAVCLRYSGQSKQAMQTLDQIKAITPEFGRAYQEEGHLYKAAEDWPHALQAYQRAVRFNPALIASWKFQAEIFKKIGEMGEAGQADAQAKRLSELPRDLVAAMNFLHEGKPVQAENICRKFLRSNPTHVEGMRLLSQIGEKLGALVEAEFLLESAVEFEPENIQLRLDFIQILRKRQKYDAAMEQAQNLYARDADNPIFQSQLAIQKMQAGEYEESVTLFEKVLEKMPNDPATLTSMGHAYKTFGLQEKGVSAYRQAANSRREFGEAYFSLANLKTYEFSNAEMQAMHDQVKNGNLTYRDRIHFLFALGKAYEDQSSFEQSFEYYNEANDLGRKQMRYDAEKMSAELSAQEKYCTKTLFEKQAGKGHPAQDPIFIVGLPRAGSTLLEQIIASHSQVDGTQELGNILSLAYRLRGRGRSTESSQYPKNLLDLPADKLVSFGGQFIEETRIHRQGAPYFIDKMPNNFRHIALIKLILPNAKIIDARRHPMACCFSGFKQHFAEGQEFTYGLENIGTYYRDYVHLMDHWDQVLPGQILRVQYEDVVADTETQIRRILDYLGLPFEQACLEFHKTKRSVRTASSEQVRQPIFKSGLEQWRNYEPWLGPLKKALGDTLDRYPIENT
ncbi:MAG: tetratricopeptide repeat protein [Hyphomonadaceae bacterium]|nr:tetratricopeptide repeat protein [Hyphomonadaceae bacterium]